MSKKPQTTAELEAWDRYYVAALNAVASPGSLGNAIPQMLTSALNEAAEVADKMLEHRRSRDPKK